MSISPGYTAEEIREFVAAYYAQPYGTRLSWLQGKEISYNKLVRWRDAIYAGDLERGLIPRTGSGLSIGNERQKRLARDTTAVIAARDAEIARLNARLAAAEETNDALGKAIGLLRSRNAQEPDGHPRSNTPSTS